MAPTLFLQSDTGNPYALYEKMLKEHPVYFDETNRLWVIYSYEHCRFLLNTPSALVPAVATGGLHECAVNMVNALARLSNNVQHTVAREAAMLLHHFMKPVQVGTVMKTLLCENQIHHGTDWVQSVCKKLPVLVVLQGMDFGENDQRQIMHTMEDLAKIMLPRKTPEQAQLINEAVYKVYSIVERYFAEQASFQLIPAILTGKYHITEEEAISLCVYNCMGLLIQSYDAGRGILSTSLLQLLQRHLYPTGKTLLKQLVIETLRFDPPFHNTRRVAADNITVNGNTICKGEELLIVIAAANRDPEKFSQPHRFNIERLNNHEHLAFGSGIHACMASHFIVQLTVDCLSWLFSTYSQVTLLQPDIEYEPRINARLPKNLVISIS